MANDQHAKATPPHSFSRSIIKHLLLPLNHVEASNMVQQVELCPVRVSEAHRPAGKEEHLWLRIESFTPTVSHWPWWEMCNQVRLASAIPVPHLH